MKAELFFLGLKSEKLPQQTWVATRTSLLNPNWHYVPSVSTNIMERFRSMGWVPPSEAKNGKTP
jgi:hypothetical protein